MKEVRYSFGMVWYASRKKHAVPLFVSQSCQMRASVILNVSLSSEICMASERKDAVAVTQYYLLKFVCFPCDLCHFGTEIRGAAKPNCGV